MSKAKFAAAKELIDEKKYDEARGILKTIGHPTARQWEAKLDRIESDATLSPAEPASFAKSPINSPATATKKPQPKRSAYTTVRGCLVIIAAIVVFYLVFNKPAAPDALVPTLTGEERAAIESTSTAAKVALLGTEVITNQTATVIALTPPTATATITDTPVPSVTPIPSATPIPTATNPPPTDVLGTKSNPYPLQGIGSVRDGRFRVNRLLRNQTTAVKATNQFNDDPPAGGEYVLVNVTFYCDLPADKTCTVSLMDLEIVGKNGKVYNKPFSTVLDTPFTGDVFGGGETSGDVAFIVASSDGNFEVIVNDLGNRTFFATGT